MKILTLALKGEYFDAIRNGSKLEEFRLRNEYWTKRLVSVSYDRIVLTRGYPKSDDFSRRIELPWRGYREITLTHPHFGDDPVEVFAICVSDRRAEDV
jgi:hypothetical protein